VKSLEEDNRSLDSDIERVWRRNRCLSENVMSQYRSKVEEFARYCRIKGVDDKTHLTLSGAQDFSRWYARRQRIQFRHALTNIRPALAAWAFARTALGESLPLWKPQPDPLRHAPSILREFADYLRQQRGNPESTIQVRITYLRTFLDFMTGRRRQLARLRPVDIDEFVIHASQRYARATVCTMCSALRGFTRFLQATGRIRVDLASSIQAPAVVQAARPFRALPWSDVRRLLRAIDRHTTWGRRNYALLLMMSVYGMGAGEAIRLTLDDIDWRAATIRVVRPKTGVTQSLPLLPAVARSLIAYLQNGRPAHTSTRHIFVTLKVPHKQFVGAVVVRKILQKYARRAGISAPFLGTHVLRHAHACRQLELGTRAKLIGDILGHRDARSIGAYLRVSTKCLRRLSLAVPR
jgi:integrase/recombinase XerD